MDCMALSQVFDVEGRYRDYAGVQRCQRGFKRNKIRFVTKNCDITVAAEFSRAVEHAGLTAHQQVLHLVGGQRRKDFANRVRDQASLPHSDKMPTASPSPSIVLAA